MQNEAEVRRLDAPHVYKPMGPAYNSSSNAVGHKDNQVRSFTLTQISLDMSQ